MHRRGCAPGARRRSEVRPADAPDIKDTALGPILISKLLILYALGATDRKLAECLESLLNASFCPSTIMNARRAPPGSSSPS